MAGNYPKIYRTLLLTTLVLASCVGCSAVPLPAIDPSGERVFLPSPSYTTVTSPFDSTPRLSCIPTPAFPEPPPIPPCGSIPLPPGGVGTGIAVTPVPERLTLTPAKVVAPIHSEVVLLAGVCGASGQLITKRPIEWMLSPDSVGNIIALSEGAHPHVSKLVGHSPRKECNNLAITRTSHSPYLLTRGTPQPHDDVLVAKGQTWISVSSPTEGVSHITAVAKETENWESRRQTATIYWVDMQWLFPPPQIVRAGQPGNLSTAVTRTSTGSPAVQAVVRYDLTGGTPASFFGSGRTSQEVPTDVNGRADVQVVQDAPGPGSTQIRVQILSAGIQGDGGSRAVIGEGYTTVTWSAPGLTVALTGPQLVSRGGTAPYRIDVVNPGDIGTEDVVVRLELPPSLRFIESRPPPAQQFGQRLEWQLGTLAPRQAVSLDVNCQAANSGEFQVRVRAAGRGVAEAVSVLATRIVESAVTVRFVDPPTTAVIGSRVEFNFEVTNTSDVPMQNVVVRDVFDAGLQPAYAQLDPSQPLQMQLGTLGPGETQRRGVALLVRRAGQLCHTLEVSAEGGHTASVRTCIEATQPALRVDVRKIGPPDARVGENIRFVIEVINTGEGPLTNLRINDHPDPGLTPKEGTLGLRREGELIVWDVGVLGVSDKLTREIVCVATAEATDAANQVEVTADGGVRETAVARLAIRPAATPSPAAPPRAETPRAETPHAETPRTPAPRPASEGKIGVEIAHLGDPSVNGPVTFIIVVRNLSSQADQDTHLTVTLPPEFGGVRLSQESVKAAVTDVAGGIAIGPIREIRGNETLPPIRLQATARKAGKYKVKVRAESRRASPVEAETDVNVIAN